MTGVPEIQILGAGLTGMSAGYHLGEDYEIHERLPHAGGLAITIEEQGYRFDRTGHLLHMRNPEIEKWVRQLLPENMTIVQRKSRVFSHGVYTRYPYQSNTYGLPPQIAYACVYGFIKSIEQRDHAVEPKTFEQFCMKFFGEGFSKHFMIPYNCKLWGVPPDEITAEWCSRFVPIPRLEDVIAGAVGLNANELGYNQSFLYPSHGIGELSGALCGQIDRRINYRSCPVGINWRSRRLVFKDRELDYKVLISTAPLDRILKLLTPAPDLVSKAGTKLRCAPLWYLDVALNMPCSMDIHWAYVPEEKYPFYRVGCYSNISPKMAPDGKACLYVELASKGEPVFEDLMPSVAKGLMEMGFIMRPEEIEFARLRHMEHAYVLYDHNYTDAMKEIRSFLDEHGIISCGRYGGWDYSSMEDALIYGRNAAEKARKILT